MKRSTELKIRAWILTAGYLALIFGVSSIPQGPLSAVCFKLSDKLAHMSEYAGFGLLLTFAFRNTLDRAHRRWLGVIVVATGAVVGALDETYQLSVPGRERELLDWVADVVGVSLGLWVSLFLKRWSLRRQEALASPGRGNKRRR